MKDSFWALIWLAVLRLAKSSSIDFLCVKFFEGDSERCCPGEKGGGRGEV